MFDLKKKKKKKKNTNLGQLSRTIYLQYDLHMICLRRNIVRAKIELGSESVNKITWLDYLNFIFMKRINKILRDVGINFAKNSLEI